MPENGSTDDFAPFMGSWERKYWDILRQIYWTPSYIGLGSISQKNWEIEDNYIKIPKSLVNMNGPLYARRFSEDEQMASLQAKEEILNHVFDLTFAILPDPLLERLFLSRFGYQDQGPFISLGREIRQRYGWSKHANITQVDGFFTSPASIVGVELKLGSDSSPGQVAKYAALMYWEEALAGRRHQLGLVYILPEKAKARHWEKCGLPGPEIPDDFLDTLRDVRLPKKITQLLETDPDGVADVLRRVRLNAMSWDELRRDLQEIHDSLSPQHLGDQTQSRLLEGFLSQLNAHGKTGLAAPE